MFLAAHLQMFFSNPPRTVVEKDCSEIKTFAVVIIYNTADIKLTNYISKLFIKSTI